MSRARKVLSTIDEIANDNDDFLLLHSYCLFDNVHISTDSFFNVFQKNKDILTGNSYYQIKGIKKKYQRFSKALKSYLDNFIYYNDLQKSSEYISSKFHQRAPIFVIKEIKNNNPLFSLNYLVSINKKTGRKKTVFMVTYDN